MAHTACLCPLTLHRLTQGPVQHLVIRHQGPFSIFLCFSSDHNSSGAVEFIKFPLSMLRTQTMERKVTVPVGPVC